MKKFLVIYDTSSGFCELANVGIFEAETPQEALKFAKSQWNTTASLYVVNLDGLISGWSYYT
jgi:hypothetical protein